MNITNKKRLETPCSRAIVLKKWEKWRPLARTWCFLLDGGGVQSRQQASKSKSKSKSKS